MKLDLLAFGAHPDDVELAAGGVMAKEAAAGRKTGIVDLTRGELGTRGSAETRDKEALISSQILGLQIRTNLQFRDGFFMNDEVHQLEVVKVLRKYRPTIVLCNAKSDRHPDHGKAGDLVSVACFLAGLLKVETFVDGKQQEPWRPAAVYHYIQDRYLVPDVVVDISEFIEVKMNSILAFSSQFYNPEMKGPATPISTPEFLNFLKARSIDFGRQAGVEFAEGFTVERYPGLNSLFDLL
jgi:bacillithiol biosynthesis deacetylase BshB1